MCSATMRDFTLPWGLLTGTGRIGVRLLVRAWCVEPPTASLAYQARVYRGCPAGTHPCDTPSRVMVCQSANSVRVAVRVVKVVSCWCRFVEKLR